MSCQWTEEQAYRYADGSLEAEPRQAFAEHLHDCPECRQRADEAQGIEGVLRAGMSPVPVPATLAARVAIAVAGEQKLRRFDWSLLFGRRLSLSPLLAALVLTLAIGIVTVLAAPEAVMAVVQRALVFVPGLGINRVDDGTLVTTGPAVVRQGNTTFTVEALLSDGKQTKLEFSLAGLPGGKEGWKGEQGSKPRMPFLRDGSGRQYAMLTGYHGTGGSAAENRIAGGMTFPPLPGELRSIDLVVPVDWLVPPSVLPGSDRQEWTVHLSLVPPAQSGLPQATVQSASQSVRGVTLRLAASNAGGDRTVVLLEGEAEGESRLLMVGRPGRNSAGAATLRDDRGRSYKLAAQGNGVTVHGESFRQDLYFEPLAPGAGQLTLEVPSVQIQEQAEATVTVPLAGRKGGESFPLDQTVTLGGHRIVLKSATLSEGLAGPGETELPGDGKPAKPARLGDGKGERWLHVDVDLGPADEGRTLASFNVKGSSSSSSFGSGDGSRMDRFGVPVDPAAQEVTIGLELPLVVVEGPWKLTFPVAGK